MITWANRKSNLVMIINAVPILVMALSAGYGIWRWTAEVKARQAEIELRASKEFLSLMEFAHGRSAPFFSEKCVEDISKRLEVSRDTPANLLHASNQARSIYQGL